MLVLYDDFGWEGPYVGQVKAVLAHLAPGIPVLDLMHDAPAFEPRASGYLLAALLPEMPPGCTVFAVIDPGVGSARRSVVLEADGRLLVAPHNGLLDPVARRAHKHRFWEISWQPKEISASFHGRDLFAPVAAKLAMGQSPEMAGCVPLTHSVRDVPADWPRVIYVDHFGNLVTGIRARQMRRNRNLVVAGYVIRPARTFSDVAPGEAFWYENSNGLVEIAVNQGYADEELEIDIGEFIEPQSV